MVGNDVVDLLDRDSDPSSLHPRFDERVFALEELRALRVCGSSTLRWRLWSAKEAAYKALKRVGSRVVFSPSRFLVWLEDAPPVANAKRWQGRVESPDGACTVTVVQRDGFVHAVARIPGPDGAAGFIDPRILVGAQRVAALEHADGEPATQSRAVRELTLRELAPAIGVDARRLEIRKRGRVPELWRDGERSAGALSFSHHGAVVGFAYEAPDPLHSSPHQAPAGLAERACGSARVNA